MLIIIKESFKLTNKYIILATPLILFSLISSLYLLFSVNGSNNFGLAFAAILFFMMLGAFLSGWLYMVKSIIIKPDQEDLNALIAEFPSGVGEYFLPILGLIFNSAVIAVILLITAYIFGIKMIGDPGISQTELTNAMTSVETLKNFLASLSTEQLIKINLWNLLLFFTMSITYFLLMFYSPAMFFKEKNPFSAIIINLKDLFSRKFFKNIILYLFICVTYFIFSIFAGFFASNVVIHFVFTLLNFYYMVFIVLLLYNYYYSNFAKIGSNVDKTI